MAKKEKAAMVAHSEDSKKQTQAGQKSTKAEDPKRDDVLETLEILAQSIRNAQDAGHVIHTHQASEDVSPGKPLVSVLIYGVTWDAARGAFALAGAEGGEG